MKRLFILIIIFTLFSLFLDRKKVFAQCDCSACNCGIVNAPWGCTGFCIETGGCGTSGCLFSPCDECGTGGCFTAGTEISVSDSDSDSDLKDETETEIEIQDIKEGDVVKSFDSEIGLSSPGLLQREIREATVSSIHKREVEGYYVLKTESGEQVKVTEEHPFLAMRREREEVAEVVQVAKVGNEKDTYQLLVKGYKFLERAWERVRNLVE